MNKLILHLSFMIMSKSKAITALALFLITHLVAQSQNIWESFSTSTSPWSISSDLTTYSNTMSKVNVKNLNFETEENRRNNKWSTKRVWINTKSYKDTPLDISFTVKNVIPANCTNNFMEKDEWYWQVVIDYTTITGQDKYFNLNYHTTKYKGSNATYQSMSTTDNGTQSDWRSITSLTSRRFRIVFEDGVIKIYDTDGDNLVKTINNVKDVRYVKVGAGPGTELEITNTSCQKMTIYGQSLPYLGKAAEYLDNNNPSSAANEMTIAINKGLKCYETYLMRGLVYYMQGYYKSAIEDLTSAINYSASNKESAYYYRGLSKLALDDDYGIDDLRKGGQDGMVFLRENNLLNYTPRQNKTKQQTTNRRNSSSSKSKKPALKK